MTFLRRPINREWLLLGSVPAALVALLTMPAILTGQIPYFMDIVMQFYPARLAAAVALHRGEFPFWNPAYYCGAPLWANPQWAIGWPGVWPFLAIPRPGVYTAVMATHLWLGALGMIAWARAAGMGRGAALTAGVFYLLNGYTWAHWAFGSYFIAMGAGPWTMALMARLRRDLDQNSRTSQTGQTSRTHPNEEPDKHTYSKFLKFIPLIALVWAWLLLSGAPQVVWLFALWFGFVAVWDTVAMGLKGNSRAARWYVACLVGAALLAFGLAAPQVLPMLALQSDLTRAEGLPLARVATGALSLADLARALFGGAGFPEDANTMLYFGAIGVALVIFGFRRSSQFRLREALALILFLLISLKIFAPVLYQILPGYARFHDPRRALTVVMPLLCFFAAGGVSQLAALSDAPFRRGALWLLGGLAPLAALEVWLHWPALKLPAGPPLPPALGWLPVPAPQVPLMFLIVFVFVILFYIGLLMRSPEFKTMPASKGRRLAMALAPLAMIQLTVFAMARIDAKFIRAADFYREPDAARLIRESGARFFAYDPAQSYSYDYTRPGVAPQLMPNTGAAFGLRDFQGYDPAIPSAYREFLVGRGIGGELYPQHFGLVQNPWAPALAEAGVRWAVGDITAFYPAAPRDALRERQTLTVPLPELLPHRMKALAVSLAAAKQPGIAARPWLIVQIDYQEGVPSRHVITPPDAPPSAVNPNELINADVGDFGDYVRAVAEVPLDPARKVAAITLAHQLAPGSLFDVRLRLDLADTGHWRRVETADPFPLYESTLPLLPPGAEWSPFDTTRPPRGFVAGMVIFGVALAAIGLLLWRLLQSRPKPTAA